MSRRDASPEGEVCIALGSSVPELVSYPTRDLRLGHLTVTRALPIKDRRLVGPWCFLDRFGPLSFGDDRPMDVAPHPHIGLQTVTWLLEGEIAHDDSLGCASVLRPGGVNVMTAGAGIAHAEQTPRHHSGRLNGVQLWTALPDADRQGPAHFSHVGEVPTVELGGGLAHVFAGTLEGAASGAPYYSPLIGAELRVHARGAVAVPLAADFEHAVLVLDGDAAVAGQPLVDRQLYYLGRGASELSVSSHAGARLLLIGGPPFPEAIVMWWNFVARTPEELVAAREDWEARRRFGDVRAYRGPRLEAPPLVRTVRPHPAG